MGWLDSFFGGSGSTDHRRYGDNEFYEYPRYGSGSSSHGSSSGGWQTGSSSSDSWRGPRIFEDPYASVYPSHGGGYPYQDSARVPDYQDGNRSYQSSGRSYQDDRHLYGYMGPGYGGYPQYGATSYEPSYAAPRWSADEGRHSSKAAATSDDESRDATDEESDKEVEDLNRNLQETLSLRGPPPQLTSVTYNPNVMYASR
jgi:hypothetical protein